MYRGVMAVCDVWSTATSFYPKENEDVERLKNWLKSLRPQNNWKPSEEQMEALDSVIDEYDGYPEFDSLVSLKK